MLRIFTLVASIIGLSACSSVYEFNQDAKVVAGTAGSEKMTPVELQAYIERVGEWQDAEDLVELYRYCEKQYSGRKKSNCLKGTLYKSGVLFEEIEVTGIMGSLKPPSDNSSIQEDGDDAITNNQVANVDEGGIVKKIGDYFIVLKNGYLFSLYVGGVADAPIHKVDQIKVPLDSVGTEGWYDEILVSNNHIMVLGYNYDIGDDESATEINRFTIDGQGNFQRHETFLLSSFDYFSSGNYASRLVGDQLIFYIQFELDENGDGVSWPQWRQLSADGVMGRSSPLIDNNSVYGPWEHSTYPIFHAVIRCPLSAATLSCDATTIIGGYNGEFYAGRDAFYLWNENHSGNAINYDRVDYETYKSILFNGEYDKHREASESVLYRVPYDGEAPTLVGIQGYPINQFSFRESGTDLQMITYVEEGYRFTLNKNSVRSKNPLRFASIPASVFQSELKPLASEYYQLFEDTKLYPEENRYLGNYAYVMLEANEDDRSHLLVKDLSGRHKDQLLTVDYYSYRLETVNDSVVSIGGTEGGDLHVMAVRAEDNTLAHSAFEMFGYEVSESRSHSFNYRRDTDGYVIAFPVVKSEVALAAEAGKPLKGNYFDDDYERMASLFLGDGLNLQVLSVIDGTQSLEALEDTCKFSCNDWYGSGRPIFLRERSFYLMGYELIEVDAQASGTRELQRVNFR